MSAAELAAAVEVSVPTLHRLLEEMRERVVTTGKARRTRYAMRRSLRGDATDLPLYEIDREGRAEQLTRLTLVRPEGTCIDLDGTIWPVPEDARDGWWDGLPYVLQDMRPLGYLGRQFARAEHQRLAVPANSNDWNDDHVLWALSQRGADTSGNLIVGDPAYMQWQQRRAAVASEPIKPRALARAYEALAEQAIAAGVPGSSAAGEFPKFPALRELNGSDTPHVLVKFSGAGRSPAVQRWSDLLVCEHLALECAALLPGAASARSRVVVNEAGRTFLEVERFDRHGLHGRSPLVSLATVNAAFVGDGSTDWTRLASRLAEMSLLQPDDDHRVQHLWWFGRLIANTDMHTGNLSLRPQVMEGAESRLTLAPAYDMLPMLYAPLPGGEVPQREFEPPLPLPPQRAVWSAACDAALVFWQRASADKRVSGAFRRTCTANARRLQDTAQHA